MSVIFTATSAAHFDSATTIFNSNTVGRYDSDYSSVGIGMANAETLDAAFSGIADGWFSMYTTNNNFGTASSVLLTADTTAIIRIKAGVDYGQIQYWNGASYTTLHTITTVTNRYIDIHWAISGTSVAIHVYVNKSLVASTTSGVVLTGETVDTLQLSGNGSASHLYRSQVMIADEPTTKIHIASLIIDGEGAQSDMTGAYTLINELDPSTATNVTSSSAEDISLYTIPSMPAIADGDDIIDVVLNAYASNDGVAPGNLQLGVNTDLAYDFSDTKVLGLGYANARKSFPINPVTGSAWDDIDSLEVGLKSIS